MPCYHDENPEQLRNIALWMLLGKMDEPLLTSLPNVRALDIIKMGRATVNVMLVNLVDRTAMLWALRAFNTLWPSDSSMDTKSRRGDESRLKTDNIEAATDATTINTTLSPATLMITMLDSAVEDCDIEDGLDSSKMISLNSTVLELVSMAKNIAYSLSLDSTNSNIEKSLKFSDIQFDDIVPNIDVGILPYVKASQADLFVDSAAVCLETKKDYSEISFANVDTVVANLNRLPCCGDQLGSACYKLHTTTYAETPIVIPSVLESERRDVNEVLASERRHIVKTMEKGHKERRRYLPNVVAIVSSGLDLRTNLVENANKLLEDFLISDVDRPSFSDQWTAFLHDLPQKQKEYHGDARAMKANLEIRRVDAARAFFKQFCDQTETISTQWKANVIDGLLKRAESHMVSHMRQISAELTALSNRVTSVDVSVGGEALKTILKYIRIIEELLVQAETADKEKRNRLEKYLLDKRLKVRDDLIALNSLWSSCDTFAEMQMRAESKDFKEFRKKLRKIENRQSDARHESLSLFSKLVNIPAVIHAAAYLLVAVSVEVDVRCAVETHLLQDVVERAAEATDFQRRKIREAYSDGLQFGVNNVSLVMSFCFRLHLQTMDDIATSSKNEQLLLDAEEEVPQTEKKQKKKKKKKKKGTVCVQSNGDLNDGDGDGDGNDNCDDRRKGEEALVKATSTQLDVTASTTEDTKPSDITTTPSCPRTLENEEESVEVSSPTGSSLVTSTTKTVPSKLEASSPVVSFIDRCSALSHDELVSLLLQSQQQVQELSLKLSMANATNDNYIIEMARLRQYLREVTSQISMYKHLNAMPTALDGASSSNTGPDSTCTPSITSHSPVGTPAKSRAPPGLKYIPPNKRIGFNNV